MRNSLNNKLMFVGLLILIPLLFVLNIWYGSVDIGWKEVILTLFGQNTGNSSEVIILQYRLPQSITALSVGMGLSLSGLLLQTTFNNPLAGPSVLGVSSGASLGVAILILFGGVPGIISSNMFFYSDLAIVAAAFAGAAMVLLIILFVSSRIGSAVTILIIGIMIGYLVSAIVGTLQYFSTSKDLHSYVLWGLGSFSKTSISQSITIFVFTLFFVMLSFIYTKSLNALLLGGRYAEASGFNVVRIQRSLILISGLLIALGTAFTGPIAFLGLAVPHIARSLFKTSNHAILLPGVLLIGGLLALFCNLIAKLPGFDGSLPINAVTSIIGAPVVIWVIIKGRRIGNG